MLVDRLTHVFTPVELGVVTLAYLQLILDVSSYLGGEQAEDRECPALLLDPIDEFRKEVYQGGIGLRLLPKLLDARFGLFDELC